MQEKPQKTGTFPHRINNYKIRSFTKEKDSREREALLFITP
jgi:hypothetical protein